MCLYSITPTILKYLDLLYRNTHGFKGSKNIYLKFKRSDVLLRTVGTAIHFLISLPEFTSPLTPSPVGNILMTCNLSTGGAMARRPKKGSANVVSNEWLRSYLGVGGGLWEVHTCGCFNATSSVFYFQRSRWATCLTLICEMLMLYAAQRGHLECEWMRKSCTHYEHVQIRVPGLLPF